MILTSRELLQLTTVRKIESEGTVTNTNYFSQLEDGDRYKARHHTTHKTKPKRKRKAKNGET